MQSTLVFYQTIVHVDLIQRLLIKVINFRLLSFLCFEPSFKWFLYYAYHQLNIQDTSKSVFQTKF